MVNEKLYSILPNKVKLVFFKPPINLQKNFSTQKEKYNRLSAELQRDFCLNDRVSMVTPHPSPPPSLPQGLIVWKDPGSNILWLQEISLYPVIGI